MSLDQPAAPPDRAPRRRRPVLVVLLLVAAMWVIEVIDWLLPADLDSGGIVARSADGLPGLLLAPLLHGDFSHLMSNTVPFLILGALVAWRSGTRFWRVLLTIVLGSGLVVWLVAPAHTVTIGASGVVFGFLAYLIVAGVMSRHWLDIVLGLAVLFTYGGLLAGALPWGVGPDVSWQAHMAGALAGVLAALLFARPAPASKAPGPAAAA